MSEKDSENSADRAQREAEEMGTTEDDERQQEQHFDETGEVPRDGLGNQDGAS